jgi:hypothetical protein
LTDLNPDTPVELPILTQHFDRQRHAEKELLMVAAGVSQVAPIVTAPGTMPPFFDRNPEIRVRTSILRLDRKNVVCFTASRASDHHISV